MVSAICISPQEDMNTAVCELYEVITPCHTYHQNAVLIVVGDVNSTSHGAETMDHCYKTSYNHSQHLRNWTLPIFSSRFDTNKV